MSTYRINIEIIDQEVENVMRILPFEAKSIIFRFVAKHIAELITEKPEEFIQLYSMAAKKDIDSMMILTGLKNE